MSRVLAAVLIAQLIAVAGSIVVGSFVATGPLVTALLLALMLSPILIGVLLLFSRVKYRILALLFGCLVFAGGIPVSWSLHDRLKDEATRRGDLILQGLSKYRESHTGLIASLTDLVPDYLDEIPKPPYLFSHFYLVDTITVGYNAPAWTICRKSIGEDWQCDD